jgi:predicted TIM-barrel fold metal-dependent hydrolase
MVVTTSGNWFEPTFLCTLLALGADNILFAVDWPFEPNASATHFLNQLSISEPPS